MLAHRLLDGPDLAGVTGPIHGIAFLGYVAAVLIERANYGWGARETAIALVASIIPFGTFYVERKMLNPAGSGVMALRCAIFACVENCSVAVAMQLRDARLRNRQNNRQQSRSR